MSESTTKAVNKGFLKRIFFNPWLRIVLEVIAFVLLVSKIIPEGWLDTQWPFFTLIAIAIVALLLSNFRLTSRLLSEIEHREAKISGIKTALEKEIIPLRKKARYADVLPMLNDAFQELHDALRRDYQDKSKYHEPIVVFCQNIEKVFTYVTGDECHVCIKMALFPKGQIPNPSQVEKILNNLQVKTYCRSSSSSSLRKQVDHAGVTHYIKDNTDFEFVVKDRDGCFYCGDLATLDEYKNSSFKPKSGGSATYFPKGTAFEERVRRWPLVYRSTIVAPIIPLIETSKEDHNILGFLCVDSKTPHAFDEKIDKQIMIGSADGIYNAFKKLFISPKPSAKKQNYPDDATEPSQV